MKMMELTVVLVSLMAVASGAENGDPKPKEPMSKSDGLAPSITLDLGGGIALEAVSIPAGKFLMGRPPSEKEKRKDPILATKPARGEFNPKLVGVVEYPQHEVTITKSFYMGKYEVSNEQFDRVMGYIPGTTRDPKGPVRGDGPKRVSATNTLRAGTITWNDTQTFCKKVSELTGRTVRLPTEAEWEYAARAGGPPPVYDRTQAARAGSPPPTHDINTELFPCDDADFFDRLMHDQPGGEDREAEIQIDELESLASHS